MFSNFFQKLNTIIIYIKTKKEKNIIEKNVLITIYLIPLAENPYQQYPPTQKISQNSAKPNLKSALTKIRMQKTDK